MSNPTEQETNCPKHGSVARALFGFDYVCSECLREYHEALDRCPGERIQREIERRMICGDPKVIRKKTWPEYFEKVLNGEKRFELRIADDTNYEEGDLLVLEEWDPETQQLTGRHVTRRIGYMLNTKDLDFICPQDVKHLGLLVMQLEDPSPDLKEGDRKCGYEWGCWFGPAGR